MQIFDEGTFELDTKEDIIDPESGFEINLTFIPCKEKVFHCTLEIIVPNIPECVLKIPIKIDVKTPDLLIIKNICSCQCS